MRENAAMNGRVEKENEGKWTVRTALGKRKGFLISRRREKLKRERKDDKATIKIESHSCIANRPIPCQLFERTLLVQHPARGEWRERKNEEKEMNDVKAQRKTSARGVLGTFGRVHAIVPLLVLLVYYSQGTRQRKRNDSKTQMKRGCKSVLGMTTAETKDIASK